MTIPTERLPRSPLMEFLQDQVDTWEEGRVVTSIKLDRKHMNPGGVVHGGVLAALMDEAMGRAIASIRGLDVMMVRPHSTIEMNISFLSAARAGDEIECDARPLRVGRTLAVAEAEVRRRPDDALIAKGRFTFAIPQPRQKTD